MKAAGDILICLIWPGARGAAGRRSVGELSPQCGRCGRPDRRASGRARRDAAPAAFSLRVAVSLGYACQSQLLARSLAKRELSRNSLTALSRKPRPMASEKGWEVIYVRSLKDWTEQLELATARGQVVGATLLRASTACHTCKRFQPYTGVMAPCTPHPSEGRRRHHRRRPLRNVPDLKVPARPGGADLTVQQPGVHLRQDKNRRRGTGLTVCCTLRHAKQLAVRTRCAAAPAGYSSSVPRPCTAERMHAHTCNLTPATFIYKNFRA